MLTKDHESSLLDGAGNVSLLSEAQRAKAPLITRALQKAILNSASFLSIATDEKGVIQIFNAGAERMLGYTAVEVINKITPADISDPQEIIARAKALSIEVGVAITPGFEALVLKASRRIEDIYELTYIRKDGSRFPAAVSVTALSDDQGAIIGYLLIGTDNTARKQVEIALRMRSERATRENEDLFRFTQKMSRTGVWDLDLVDHASRRSLGHDRIFGYDSLLPQWNYKMFLEHVIPEDRAEVERRFGQAVTAQTNWNFECRIRRVDGEVRWILASGEHQHDEMGQARRMVGIVQDITELKQAEEQLRRSEESVRLMVECVTDLAIIQLDAQGRVLSWNVGAQRIKGYRAAEIIGQHFSRFYSDADIKSGKPQSDLDVAAATGRYEAEGWRARKDGSAFWANLVLTAIRDRAGNLRGFAKLTHDLTERRQVEQELKRARDEALQALRAKSAFLANMSHEIRTPMNGVIGMTEILLDTPLTPTQRDVAETIRFSGQALLTITNDILDFSKMAAGMLRVDIADLSVYRVLEQVIELFAEPAANKGLKLDLFVDAGVPLILRGDQGRLRQVLTNLVANAVKFTDHGEVVVRAALERASGADAFVRFTVRDSGIGISKEAQQGLFQPFTQADSSTTRKYGGSGLGLAISKQLVELMGGEIGVESEHRKGSSFWFTARLEKSAAPAKLVPMTPAEPPISASECVALSGDWQVLVAEDNPVNQRVVQHQLARLGLRADVVDNGRQAVEALQFKRYDLVLMDCQMPELDGYAATAEVRRREGSDRHTWIIAMTAHAMAGDREKCLAADMDDYIAKPVSCQAMREVLERFEAALGGPACASELQYSPLDLASG